MQSLSLKMGDTWSSDQRVERGQFFLGVCTQERCPAAALEHCHLMTSGGRIFPSMCARVRVSQAIQPCYIFLHSFPPVLSFTLSKEPGSVANTQSKVVHVPGQPVALQELPGAFSFSERLIHFL